MRAWCADDGPHDGLLVFGRSEGDDSLVGLWGDSWHQSPAPQVCSGSVADGTVMFEYEYAGGWRWRILADAAGDGLELRMQNVVPEGDAEGGVPPGPYDAMVIELTDRGDG